MVLKWSIFRSQDIILKVDHLRTIHPMFALNWLTGFRAEDLNIFSIGSYVKIQSSHGGHLEFPISKRFTSLPCELSSWVSVRLSVSFSHLNLLLWNRWTEISQTCQKCSLDGPLPDLCFWCWFEIQPCGCTEQLCGFDPWEPSPGTRTLPWH
jgi:hypothetical protein